MLRAPLVPWEDNKASKPPTAVTTDDAGRAGAARARDAGAASASSWCQSSSCMSESLSEDEEEEEGWPSARESAAERSAGASPAPSPPTASAARPPASAAGGSCPTPPAPRGRPSDLFGRRAVRRRWMRPGISKPESYGQVGLNRGGPILHRQRRRARGAACSAGHVNRQHHGEGNRIHR